MGDVHLISVNKNGKSLSNSMNSIASTISPSLAPHDLTNILNCNPENICQADPGAWQHFLSSENLHNSFSSQLPSLGIASSITLPQTGYEPNDETIEGAMIRELIGRLGNGEFDNGFASRASHATDYSYKFGEEDGWRGVDSFSNICFSLDLPLENNSLPVTSLAASSCLAGIPSDPGNAESHFFCHATSSQFQPDCLASSKLAPMATVKEHIPAFISPSARLQSRGKAMQPSCQREEECSEHSSGSSHNAVQNPSTPVKGTSGKKRKGSEDKIVDVPSPVTRAEHKIVKKHKMEDMKMKEQKSSERIKQAFRDSGCTNTKDPEPPKQDFIHVRARRGQATDSRSLAERVRREKISERMKLLQDLVPGCSKVSGKALMLDEIINYVQSLQCQVEILSMKLASLNKRPNFSLDDIFSEEMSNLWMKKNKASFR